MDGDGRGKLSSNCWSRGHVSRPLAPATKRPVPATTQLFLRVSVDFLCGLTTDSTPARQIAKGLAGSTIRVRHLYVENLTLA